MLSYQCPSCRKPINILAATLKDLKGKRKCHHCGQEYKAELDFRKTAIVFAPLVVIMMIIDSLVGYHLEIAFMVLVLMHCVKPTIEASS